MHAHLETGVDCNRRNANAVEALYATGHRFLSRDRWSDAACVYRAMVTCAPRDERGWLALGACHERLGQRDLALQLYTVGRALSRSGGRCELAQSRLFRAMGKLEQAREAMECARRHAEAIDDQELLALIGTEERPS